MKSLWLSLSLKSLPIGDIRPALPSRSVGEPSFWMVYKRLQWKVIFFILGGLELKSDCYKAYKKTKIKADQNKIICFRFFLAFSTLMRKMTCSSIFSPVDIWTERCVLPVIVNEISISKTLLAASRSTPILHLFNFWYEMINDTLECYIIYPSFLTQLLHSQNYMIRYLIFLNLKRELKGFDCF